MKALAPPRRGPHPRPRTSAGVVSHPEDASEGAEILAEVSGPAALLLWGALRDLLLWVNAPASARRTLFPSGAGAFRRDDVVAAAPAQELWAPLLTLAQMADAPGHAEPGRVAYAARSIARWAERNGAPGTRLVFTHAAALALPADAHLALETARLARDLARHAQAEAWFRRAIRLARGRAWDDYVWGYIGLGVHYMRAGNYPAAQAVVGRALRAARKRRLTALEGTALHHMFVFDVDAHRMAEAYEHARGALRAYGSAHPRLPALAHDIGCFWAEQGQFARALRIFDAVLPYLTAPADRLMALANLARSSAGAGACERYESARAQAVAMAATPECAPLVTEALLMLAQADGNAGEHARAEATAEEALSLANRRAEGRARMVAEAILDAARNARAIRVSGLPETPVLARTAEELATELCDSLSRHAAFAAVVP